MHKMVNGIKINLTEKEIKARKADEVRLAEKKALRKTAEEIRKEELRAEILLMKEEGLI